MIDRFFVVRPDQAANYKAVLMADNDLLPIDVFVNAMDIYRDTEKVLLRVRLDMPTINELQEQTSCADPLSLEAVEVLEIVNTYVGPTLESIFTIWPELEGKVQSGTDEDGSPIMTDIVSTGVWA